MNIQQIMHDMQNMLLPVYCSMCGCCVYKRQPICNVCVRAIDPIAPLDVPITRTRMMSVAAAARYDSSVAAYAMAKHRGDVAAINELGWLMAVRCHHALQHVDLLIPVPLHWRRYAYRGFNQAELIAKRISRETGIPYARGLKRVTWHGSQSGRSPQQRHVNVYDAFKLNVSQEMIHDKRIALVDDVMASGATITEAARILRNGGPSTIYGIVGVRVV